MRKLFRAVLASMAVAAALTGCGGKKVKLRQTAGLKGGGKSRRRN